METVDVRKIRKKLEKDLDHKRFEHTLGVAYTACALAMCHQADIGKAQIAGLLHDCAKCMDNEKKISICQKQNIPITDIEKKNPYLLHAKVGCYIARKQFHIHDKDILNAVLNHTTGRPEMSPLEKIIYIADYIEPGRKHAPNLSEVRKLAFKDIDAALLKILKDTLEYLKSIDSPVDPATQQTYDYYIKRDHTNKKQEV
ncbi:MAG: bis(5'-nucleosyl)-tetraphosphatase (symmetrical) YqeK [Lachnospiraceae bacterium]|nr:bis(5'-nucleosyl)-tetraphosphatase (symmetrical) YqeK [Lachnospiraceae bacterium]MDE6185387.1 bis(5'-nucleosyl)-tetraphosphatase (symmetrical) YqeK [Lachnospiraceae bacterium]MDE7287373.1 bis(5'-nucleosyl)-tetraphosphatase (symmetrical) YqeK [Lachnospiraceae bacterium]